MIYDFETLVSRKNTGSGKWDEMTKEHPNLPENVAPLSVADMELKNPPEIVEGLKKYIDTHILGYTGPTEEYFDAVCGWMKRRNDWNIKKEEIVSTHGVVTVLAVSVLAYTDPGDGVITMPPVYYPFRMTIEHNNRKNVECPLINTNETYTIDFDLFEKLCAEEKNKMFIFCNPHNPVGRVWTKEELTAIGDLCVQYGVTVVSDEIHGDFIFKGEHQVFTAIKKEYEDITITCTAPSKTFNLASMMMSNIFIANPELRAKFRKQLDAAGTSQLGVMGLVACETAYNKGEEWYEAMLSYVKANAEFTRQYVEEQIPGVKMIDLEGTYLVWLDFRETGLSVDELEDLIINKAKLWLDSGKIFGDCGRGFQRINIACPRATLTEALERIRDAMKSR